jgi:hypothetical protein
VILASGAITFSGVELTLWILGGGLVGVLVGRGIAGGLSRLVGDLVAGVLGALAAIALVSYFVDLASYSFGGRLVVAMVGGAIFVAAVHGSQYRRARRPAPPAQSATTAAEDLSTREPEPDDSYPTPTATT